jgi:hypothetical protein
MSVIDIKQNYTGVEGGGDRNVRRFTRVYTVLFDSPLDGPPFTYPLTDGVHTIPTPDTPDTEDAAYLADMPQFKSLGPRYFEFKVTYSTPDATAPAGGYSADPLAAPAELTWSLVRREVPIDTDILGDPILNTLGEPFEGLTLEINDVILRIARNEATFPYATYCTLAGSVCETGFMGFAAGKSRLTDMQAKGVYAVPPYVQTSFEVTIRIYTPAGVDADKAWYGRVLNTGTKYLDGDGVLRKTPNGERLALKSDGTLLEIDDLEHTYWKEYQQFSLSSWAWLALD